MPKSNWPEFERLVQIETDDCVIWPHGCSNGYPESRRLYLHTVACEMANGPRPTVRGERVETAHSCGVKRCINRRHLRWATASENNADKVGHGSSNRGRSSKLQASDVREIRAARRDGVSVRVIAANYGIARTTVYNIEYRYKWGWLSD